MERNYTMPRQGPTHTFKLRGRQFSWTFAKGDDTESFLYVIFFYFSLLKIIIKLYKVTWKNWESNSSYSHCPNSHPQVHISGLCVVNVPIYFNSLQNTHEVFGHTILQKVQVNIRISYLFYVSWTPYFTLDPIFYLQYKEKWNFLYWERKDQIHHSVR